MDAVLALLGKVSHPPHHHQVADLPKDVIERIKNTIVQIANEAIRTLLFNSLSTKLFVEIHVDPFHRVLSNINDRTYCFFQKMMVPINETLNQSSNFCTSIELLQIMGHDQDLRRKFVEGISLQPIKDLIKSLDVKDHSLVDDINAFEQNLEIKWQ